MAVMVSIAKIDGLTTFVKFIVVHKNKNILKFCYYKTHPNTLRKLINDPFIYKMEKKD